MKDKYFLVADAILNPDIRSQALAVSLCDTAELEGDTAFLKTWREVAIWCAEHVFHLMDDPRSREAFSAIHSKVNVQSYTETSFSAHLFGANDAFLDSIENDERASNRLAAGAAMSVCYSSPALAAIRSAAFTMRALGAEAAAAATDNEGEPLFTAVCVPADLPWCDAQDARQTAEYQMHMRLTQKLGRYRSSD